GGVITTLAYYSDGSPHPGVNAIDVGAPGGSAVWYQTDYLGSSVAGGWLRVEPVHEAGLCSQWSSGSPYYNGAKIYVYAYFYGRDGNYLGSHRAAFQHVVPAGDGAWVRFNNSASDAGLWPSPDATLNDGTSGGV